MAGGAAAASALLGAEVCAPLLLACWLLCCWPDDASDDTSSTGKHPKKPIVSHEWARRRGSSSRGSAASLHLPGPSGQSSRLVPLSGHRSHEELRGARHGAAHNRSHEELRGMRHGAASVIDEVMARRVWRSARDLTLEDVAEPPAPASPSPPPPRCKKHHSNTKRSRRDVTEEAGDVTPKFYIGPVSSEPASVLSDVIDQLQSKQEAIRCLYRAKEGKQWFNESLRGARADTRADTRACSRSGARHGARTPSLPDNYPPASVEPAQYESGAGYLPQSPGPRPAPRAAPAGARHASDGDILSCAPRPESGAFSESDVELSLRGTTIPIPAPRDSPAHVPRETAI